MSESIDKLHLMCKSNIIINMNISLVPTAGHTSTYSTVILQIIMPLKVCGLDLLSILRKIVVWYCAAPCWMTGSAAPGCIRRNFKWHYGVDI